MGVDAEVARSRGDVMHRLRQLEKLVERLAADRRLEAASIGRGGLRIQGGRLLAEDVNGDRVFEVTTDPPTIFLRKELITALAVDIFADRISSSKDPKTAFRSLTTYGDLDGVGAIPGPSVTAEISSAGKALVLYGCDIDANSIAGAGKGGRMSIRVTGASDIPADVGEAYQNRLSGDDSLFVVSSVRALFANTYEDLVPGTNTFKAEYRTEEASAVTFGLRTVIVIAG